jgi:hypothetical protein
MKHKILTNPNNIVKGEEFGLGKMVRAGFGIGAHPPDDEPISDLHKVRT